MYDLHKVLTNPFDDPGISVNHLLAFTTDHLAKVAGNNPNGFLTARVAATTAALAGVNTAFQTDQGKLGQRVTSKAAKRAFLQAMPAAISKIYVVLENKYGENAAALAAFFPNGRKEFNQAPDDQVGNNLSTLIAALTAKQPDLGAQVVTDATALLTGWNAVYAPSESSSGDKKASMGAKNAARSALQLELFKTLLTIGLQYPRQPGQLDAFMQPSLLWPHTPTPPAPTPADPVAARDANGMWTWTYGGAAQTYVQVWARDSVNGTWTNTGDMQTAHFPAPDADIVPDNVTWWQVKFCGEDGDGNQSTTFSNVISFGPVPA
jgi:hypothetical protein